MFVQEGTEKKKKQMIKEAKEAFPAPEYRTFQEESVEEIATGFVDNDAVVLNAPTGVGKSVVGSAFAFSAGATIYTTPQTSLVEQIENDELLNDDEHEYVAVYGRANYSCYVSRNNDKIKLKGGTKRDIERCSASKAPCRRFNGFDYEEHGPCCNPKEVNGDNYHEACPYAKAVYDAKQALENGGNIITSFSYFLMAPHFGNADLLVIDEAHNLESEGLQYSDIYITENTIPFWEELRVPKTREPHKVINWLQKSVGRKVDKKIEQLRQKHEKSIQELERMDELRGIRSNIELIDEMRSEYVIEDAEYCEGLIFKPLQVAEMFRNKVFGKADRSLLMSATIFEEMLPDIGLYKGKEVEYIESQHVIKASQRPLRVIPTASMTYSADVDGIPLSAKEKVADKIVEIMEEHDEEKGVVHCHTYQIQDQLEAHLKEAGHGDRIISHGKGLSRQDAIDEFRAEGDDGNSVLLSVAMTEGLDMEYDHARWNVIAKTPFGNLEDSRIKKRLEQNNSWYYRNAIIDVIQAYGRTTRAPDDWSVTYILDSKFKDLYENARSSCPHWFNQAVTFDAEVGPIEKDDTVKALGAE